MTNDLASRIIEHYNNRGETATFAGRYFCYYLIYYETFQFANQAIEYEKEIKRMNRLQKEQLIESKIPNGRFLIPLL